MRYVYGTVIAINPAIPWRHGMNILLIEDDRNFGWILKRELEAEDHRVNLAGDGVDGILSFIDAQYDIVLLDIRMPRLNGLDALRILKRLDPAMPVIAFSANTSPRDIADTEEAGALVCLTKPFEVAQLKREIACCQ
jgi:two-component system response regulator AtoC